MCNCKKIVISFCTDSRMLTIWRWFEYGAYRQQSKINLVDIGILWIYIDDSAVWVIPHQVHFTPDFALGGAQNLQIQNPEWSRTLNF